MEVLEVVRKLDELEREYEIIERIEKNLRLEKRAAEEKVPTPVTVSHQDKKRLQSWMGRLHQIYLECRRILQTGSICERAILYEHLRRSSIPELSGLSTLSELFPIAKHENAREKCFNCVVAHMGWPHRKKGLELRKSKSTGPNYKKINIICEGYIGPEELLPPCERVLRVPEVALNYLAKITKLARSVDEIKAKAQEVSIRVKKFKLDDKMTRALVTYKRFEDFQVFYRKLVKIDRIKHCPFEAPEQPYIEAPTLPEAFMVERAPDHFVSDITYDPHSGEVFHSPKHGEKSLA